MYQLAGQIIDADTVGTITHDERPHTVGSIAEGDFLYFREGKLHCHGFACHGHLRCRREGHLGLGSKSERDDTLGGRVNVQGLLGDRKQTATQQTTEGNDMFYHSSRE